MNAVTITSGRQGHRQRRTREISLEVAVDLDRAGAVAVQTDIGFLNQLIGQLARQGGFSLYLACEGGPRADARLIVEDCALELGGALRDALGDGIENAQCTLACRVEEAEARVAVAFSGGPGAEVSGPFGARPIGGLPAELVPVFFHSLARPLGARIRLDVSGEVTTHVISACFRGAGLAIRGVLSD